MGKPTFQYKSPNHGADLNDMKENWCDVTIMVNGGIKYRAHKIVLAANLKYFETILLNSNEKSERDIIDMTGTNLTDLAPFISYAYTGKISLNIDNALSLLKDAHRLNEGGIKEVCLKFLRRHLKKEEACCAYIFARTIDSAPLKDAATAIIKKNLVDCSKTTDFLNVDYEDLKTLLDDAKPDAKSQEVLFEGIIRWVMHNVPSRRDHTNNLLSLIDMSKLTAEYMMNYLENISNHNDTDGIIHEILSCYGTSKRLKNKRRTVLILDCHGKLSFQCYDLIDRTWSPLKKLLIPNDAGYSGKEFGESVVLNDKLYYIHNDGILSFDISSRKIDVITLGRTEVTNFIAMCACNEFLYLHEYSQSYSIETKGGIIKYDPGTNYFERLAYQEFKVISNGAAIFYQNCIHLLGGTQIYARNECILKSVIKYDPVTDKQKQFPSMCEERCNHAVAVLDGKMYACGGSDKNSVEVYEPATKGWRRVASMNKQRHGFLVVAYEGKLFAFGGDKEKTMEVYDPFKDQWQIDQEASSGLRIRHPRGGLISDKCLQQRVLKRPSEPSNVSSPNAGDDDREVQPPLKKIKN